MRLHAAAAGAIVAGLAIAASASATTLSVTVQPPGFGTPAAPKAQDVTFDISSIRQGSDGHPTVALVRLEEQLPPQFTSEVAQFATCPASAFAHLGPQPPACPAASQLGTGQFSAYIPSLASSVTTDKGYIYKTGPDRFKTWVHVSHLTSAAGTSTPLSISFALAGTLTAGSATSGPTATFDLSDAVNQGVEARVTHFNSAWNAMGTAPAARRHPGRKHRRHRHHGGRRGHGHRARAYDARRRHRRRGHTRPRGHATPVNRSVSPFDSTARPGTSWSFSTIAFYRDGSSETLSPQVYCHTGSSTPPPPPHPCLPVLPVCVPTPGGAVETAPAG